MTSPSYKVAFYVSGHGFGHATRAAALTTALLSAGHSVTIVTNAPAQPFSSVLETTGTPGPFAAYRHADVDAGIVQPKAYDVARQATFEVLKAFLDRREATLVQEETWLRGEGIQVVLSDSTFLGCAAGGRASIPAILVSNFSFDSCYSYLSHPAPQVGPDVEPALDDALLSPLVKQAIADYSAASLNIRLPGAIPIPAFDTTAPLPSGRWVNEARDSFTPQILQILDAPPGPKVIDAPMIVRPPSAEVYTPEFRHQLLKTMHVPQERWDSKILLVSFGGQAIPRPRSRPPSPNTQGKQREPGLLPSGWIAIVCGLGKANEIRNDLPDGFYASEHDVYVPDLTATADVVLGKLGYGTCSETLSCKTPFIYVPRPLFIEEFGLKRLMLSTPETRASTIELSRTDFESGRWETAIEAAWEGGKAAKEEARKGWKDNGAAATIVSQIEGWLAKRNA